MLSKGSYNYRAGVLSGSDSASVPPPAPARPLCLSTKCLLTHSHGTKAEDLVKGGRRANGPTVHGHWSGHHCPKAGQEALGHTADETETVRSQKTGRKGERKGLAKAEALPPDGPTGFESGTKVAPNCNAVRDQSWKQLPARGGGGRRSATTPSL